MSKSAKKRSNKTAVPRVVIVKPTDDAASHVQSNQGSAGSKQARVIAMLQSPDGATIAGLMQATGWQQHSVRGFLAGVVRKKLKLKLSSTKIDDHRVYRIERGKEAKPSGRQSKRRAA